MDPVALHTRSSAIAVIADRTACSILTLFIVIATSGPLNKKSLRSKSAVPIITVDADGRVRSPHTSAAACTLHGTVCHC